MEIEVKGSQGRAVRATSHGDVQAPAVLVAHGFKGFRNWGFFPWLCDHLAGSGLRAVRVDFSHNGVESHDFDRLDLFLLDTPERHQEDLRALAASLPGPLALVGHSRGGGDVLLFAAEEPRVRAVATLASVASTRVEPPDLEAQLRSQGVYLFPNARTKQQMPVARTAFESGRRLDLERAVRELTCPALFIHGEDDESVSVAALEQLHSWYPRAQTLRLPATGHTFGAVHPFAGPTPALRDLATRLAAFLQESLKGTRKG